MIIAIILALTGLILIHVEFYLPGSIMGILGGFALVGSIVSLFFASPHPLVLISFLIVLFVLLCADIKLALWLVRKTGKKATVFLDSDQEGYQASSFQKNLRGKKGEALSDLKPSGYIKIDGKFLQATSKGGYIEKGAPIVIVNGEGAHLIVKEIKEVKKS